MRRALVVDDDPDIRLLICAMLRGRGWEPDEASGGAEGIERFDDQHTLVILDYKMPDLSGYDVAMKLRAGGYGGPIVMYTAYATRELEARVRDAVQQPVYFVSKTDFPKLTQIIDALG